MIINSKIVVSKNNNERHLKFYTLAADVDYVPWRYRGNETRPLPVNGNIAEL